MTRDSLPVAGKNVLLALIDSKLSMAECHNHNGTVYTPFLAALFSIAVFVLQTFVAVAFKADSGHQTRLPAVASAGGERYTSQSTRVCRCLRFCGCLILLCLSIPWALEFDVYPKLSQVPMVFINGAELKCILVDPHVCMAFVFGYISLLTLPDILPSFRERPIVTQTRKHATIILLAAWVTYTWRDLIPLATFHQLPQDIDDGATLLWSKLLMLTVTAVVIPLFTPSPYKPYDSSAPMEPSKEQTSSWFGYFLLTYLDSFIWSAWLQGKITFDELPVISDRDCAKNLIDDAFPSFDPSILSASRANKEPKLFLGLLRIFWRNWLAISLTLIFKAGGGILSPIGLYQLLVWMANPDPDTAIARPWVWIAWLFLVPLLLGICSQTNYRLQAKMGIRVEAIMTALIFHHALRARTRPSRSNNTAREASTAEADKDTDNSHFMGRINNLVSSDLDNLLGGCQFLTPIIYIPLVCVISSVFLYRLLGWSALIGLAFIAISAPLPVALSKISVGMQKKSMQKTDARVEAVTEATSVIRMLKLFGWERQISARINQTREAELVWIKKQKVLEAFFDNINTLIPALTMIITFVFYTAVMKQTLDAATVFSSISVFQTFQEQVHMVFWTVPSLIKAKVSLDRIGEFLAKTELLDEFEFNVPRLPSNVLPQDAERGLAIGYKNATFTWALNPDNGAVTPSKRNFKLQIDELFFKKGGFNLILGPTGSGKTSLLMALLGEMHFLPDGLDSWYNLPRSGGIAYAAQESWVLNETIKDNILFGSKYDKQRYRKVIHQCGLERDLSLFAAGDATEVGEKGVTLSGGQKARLTLARAVYSPAQILLLDDVLAALDVHTAKFIVEFCFLGDLVKDTGRTVILTHNVFITRPIADFVVSLRGDGRVLNQGSLSDILSQDSALLKEAAEDAEITTKPKEEIPPKLSEAFSDTGKLIIEEESAEGHMALSSVRLYFTALGGNHPLLFAVFIVLGFFLVYTLEAASPWWLGRFAAAFASQPASEVNVTFYLTFYAIICLLYPAVAFIVMVTYVFGTMRASRRLHAELAESILTTTFRWLDKTPSGRILTRFTKDMQTLDGSFAWATSQLMETIACVTMKFVGVLIYAPIFGTFGVAIAILGGSLGQIYMKAQLTVKREMSKAKAPVLSHFEAAIAGITSIRAYGAQSMVKAECLVRIDRYTRSARTYWDLNRWLGVRADALGGIFAASLAAYFLYIKENAGASNSGFSMTMAVGFGSLILWLVRMVNLWEVEANSIERITGYICGVEHEPKFEHRNVPPAAWPTSGGILVENLCARYSKDGPEVLHSLSFHIRSGERVGIVGRTGSGKSSLTLSLLRLIPTEGEVYYDGLPISEMNLENLRSNVTIIPQNPELLSGSLRENLDLFNQHDDAELNEALRSAGLFSLHVDDDENRITLDTSITSGGGNISVGQRQIIALARAMLRNSKLLILDEATSAIDYNTDAIIQTSLRNELKKDVTVLTIAHRLQTIMDNDRIMVLDAGRIAEFDTPSRLLKSEGGLFKALVDESSDKDVLYGMVSGEAGGSR